MHKQLSGLSYGEILKALKFRIITFFTPCPMKIQYLKQMESKAEKIAKNKNIFFPFRLKIKYGKGKSFASIGYSGDYNKKINGKFDIYIFSTLVMAPEIDILITIFHEYGHFIYYHAPLKTIWPLWDLDYIKKFPRLTPTNEFEEDFSELFAYITLDKVDLNKFDSKLLEEIEIVRCHASLVMEKIPNTNKRV